MIYRIFYSYYQRYPEGGPGNRVETSKIIDAKSGADIQKEIDKIIEDNDCGYRSAYKIGDIVRLDK